MCGIAGVLYADPSRPVDRALLEDMGESIAHRGPDAQGFWVEPGVGLVHRRLSIIDLEGGDQPIGNEDGSVQVVFNGEIYNFHQLRAGLEAKGHRFRTRSDTEVLVHLYEEEGENLVERLRGMFAFALWDCRRKSLLLARDHLGIKPLYFYRDGEKLLFGSELKAILAYPGLPRTVSPEGLEDYLTFGMVPGGRSIFRGVEKLPPAHVLTVHAGDWERRPRRYWRLQLQADESRSPHDWEEAVRAMVAESVRLQMVADVPVGAFLSGGIDSSVVVASVGRSLQTFSIGFEEEAFSELPYAAEIAGRFGTQHREEVVTADAISLLDELTHYYDEPFADSSAVPTYLVSRLARRSVKVVLSGDGGDEAFGGYARYVHDLKEAALRRLLPGGLRRAALGPLARVWPKADWLPRPLRLKTFLTNLSLEDKAAYANTLSLCRPPLRRQLLAPDMAARLDGYRPEDLVQDAYATAPEGDALSGMIAADVASFLPDDYLVKVDRASMAHGLEVRPPLLDHKLLELTATIPSHWKVHQGQSKWILKQAFREQLPAGILKRPKQGFEVPIDAWLRGPLRPLFEDSVLGPRSPINDLLSPEAVRGLYRAHLSGVGRHGATLWTALVLARWAERYLSAGRPAAPPRAAASLSSPVRGLA